MSLKLSRPVEMINEKILSDDKLQTHSQNEVAIFDVVLNGNNKIIEVKLGLTVSAPNVHVMYIISCVLLNDAIASRAVVL